jgi:hypothetical protein
MGQYRQWLHYQAIDRHLRTQLEALQSELSQIEEHLHLLEQQQPDTASLNTNPIVQALSAHLKVHHSPPKSTTKNMHRSTNSLVSDLQSPEPGDTISTALSGWGELPNFRAQAFEEPIPAMEQVQSLTSHPEIELLPEDILAFFDEHSQTDPQLELPWWLRSITVGPKDEQGSRPIDQNSIRTNRLVQRWIERWGRRSSSTLKPPEKEEGSS